MAVIGPILDIMGMDCRMALKRKTTLENRMNCFKIERGRKVIML